MSPAVALAAALLCATAIAQDSAGKPRRIVTIEAGGGNDTVARLVAQGWSQQLTDLICGQVQLSIISTGTLGGHIKNGQLRALAVTSAQPTMLAPGLPTLASAGLPGYEVVSTYGVFAPAKTPANVIARINQEIVRGLQSAENRERFFSAGSKVVAGTQQAFAVVIAAEQAKLGKLLRDVK